MKNMDEMNLSILREVCNIASGSALKSLIGLTGLNLDIGVPKVELADFRELPTIFGSEDSVIAAVSQDVQGEINSSILLGLDGKSIKILLENINKVFDLKSNIEIDIDNLDESQISILSEVGSILSGSYISSISDFIKAESSLTAPTIAIDMSGAILSQVLCNLDQEDDRILLIGTNIYVDNEIINAKIVLLPKHGALDYLLDTVRARYVNV